MMIMFLLQNLTVYNSHHQLQYPPLTLTTTLRKLSKILIKKETKQMSTTGSSAAVPATKHSCVGVVNKSSQTLDTAFSLCASCTDKTSTLLYVVKSLGNVCHSLSGKSSLMQIDWKGLLDTDRFQEQGLLEAVYCDASSSTKCFEQLKSLETTQQETVRYQKGLISQLQTQCDTLCSDVANLEQKLNVARQDNHKLLSATESSFTAKINELLKQVDSEAIKYELLLKESTNLRKTESTLKQQISKQGEVLLKVNKAIESSQKNEIRLKSFNDELAVRISDLQSQLVNEKKEREKLQLEMDHTAVELRKAKAQISNLNDKCKSLLSEQKNLVARISELDSQYVLLEMQHEELLKEKSYINQKLLETTSETEQYHTKLSQEKEEKYRVIKENGELQEETSSLRNRLMEECHSKHLLMEYPFTDDIRRVLCVADSDKCVTANTTRIKLLEEQNSILRRRTLNRSQCECKQPLQLKHPLRLWQPTEWKPSITHKNSRPSKGRFGCLTDALAHVAGNSTDKSTVADASEIPLQTFLCCSHCDVMFLSKSELDAHVCDIETIVDNTK